MGHLQRGRPQNSRLALQQVAAQQRLVKVPGRNGHIGHINFQGGGELEGHGGGANDVNGDTVGAADLYARLRCQLQPVPPSPFCGHQGNSRAGVNHHESPSLRRRPGLSIAPGARHAAVHGSGGDLDVRLL